ncbi:MAG: YeeE/YedE family protein [Alphaproteobacteria bacterium]|nr:YeeE/YedE family protein [Alphaproteobacteria bacterium]
MQKLLVLISGAVFGAGLTISGMVNPAKILNFLDLAGQFDGTLIFVMGAGLAVTAIGYYLVLRRGKPLFDSQFHLPTAETIDARLMGGAALFGLGWGLSGLCPGPALASLVFGYQQSFIFVAAMLVGTLLVRFIPAQNKLD